MNRSIFSEAVARMCNFVKKDTLVQVFSCEFCEVSKNTFYRTPPVAKEPVEASLAKWLSVRLRTK